MFPPHLILLTTHQNAQTVTSLDRLTQSSDRFDQFAKIEVLNWANQFEQKPVARYHIDEDRWFLISYNAATCSFAIDAEYPEELWEAGDFNLSHNFAYAPDSYPAIVVISDKNSFNPVFNPTTRIWTAEDLSQGIYSHRRDITSGRSGSIIAVATPNLGRWVMQEVE